MSGLAFCLSQGCMAGEPSRDPALRDKNGQTSATTPGFATDSVEAQKALAEQAFETVDCSGEWVELPYRGRPQHAAPPIESPYSNTLRRVSFARAPETSVNAALVKVYAKRADGQSIHYLQTSDLAEGWCACATLERSPSCKSKIVLL